MAGEPRPDSDPHVDPFENGEGDFVDDEAKVDDDGVEYEDVEDAADDFKNRAEGEARTAEEEAEDARKRAEGAGVNVDEEKARMDEIIRELKERLQKLFDEIEDLLNQLEADHMLDITAADAKFAEAADVLTQLGDNADPAEKKDHQDLVDRLQRIRETRDNATAHENEKNARDAYFTASRSSAKLIEALKKHDPAGFATIKTEYMGAVTAFKAAMDGARKDKNVTSRMNDWDAVLTRVHESVKDMIPLREQLDAAYIGVVTEVRGIDGKERAAAAGTGAGPTASEYATARTNATNALRMAERIQDDTLVEQMKQVLYRLNNRAESRGAADPGKTELKSRLEDLRQRLAFAEAADRKAEMGPLLTQYEAAKAEALAANLITSISERMALTDARMKALEPIYGENAMRKFLNGWRVLGEFNVFDIARSLMGKDQDLQGQRVDVPKKDLLSKLGYMIGKGGRIGAVGLLRAASLRTAITVGLTGTAALGLGVVGAGIAGTAFGVMGAAALGFGRHDAMRKGFRARETMKNIDMRNLDTKTPEELQQMAAQMEMRAIYNGIELFDPKNKELHTAYEQILKALEKKQLGPDVADAQADKLRRLFASSQEDVDKRLDAFRQEDRLNARKAVRHGLAWGVAGFALGRGFRYMWHGSEAQNWIFGDDAAPSGGTGPGVEHTVPGGAGGPGVEHATPGGEPGGAGAGGVDHAPSGAGSGGSGVEGAVGGGGTTTTPGGAPVEPGAPTTAPGGGVTPDTPSGGGTVTGPGAPAPVEPGRPVVPVGPDGAPIVEPPDVDSFTPDATERISYVVGKGEGISHALKRQLEAHAANYGYDATTDGDKSKWVMKTLLNIMDNEKLTVNGQTFDIYDANVNKQWWVDEPDRYSFILSKNLDGTWGVQGYDMAHGGVEMTTDAQLDDALDLHSIREVTANGQLGARMPDGGAGSVPPEGPLAVPFDDGGVDEGPLGIDPNALAEAQAGAGQSAVEGEFAEAAAGKFHWNSWLDAHGFQNKQEYFEYLSNNTLGDGMSQPGLEHALVQGELTGDMRSGIADLIQSSHRIPLTAKALGIRLDFNDAGTAVREYVGFQNIKPEEFGKVLYQDWRNYVPDGKEALVEDQAAKLTMLREAYRVLHEAGIESTEYGRAVQNAAEKLVRDMAKHGPVLRYDERPLEFKY